MIRYLAFEQLLYTPYDQPDILEPMLYFAVHPIPMWMWECVSDHSTSVNLQSGDII